jgi:hypothetical protein
VRLPWQIGVFLLACTPRETVPVMTVAQTVATTPAIVAVEPPKPASAGIEIACSYAIEAMHFDAATPLCAQRNADCFINLKPSISGKLAVMVPTGTVTHLVTVLELGAARFHGQIAGADVRIGPKAPTVIDGWIMPLALGSLRIDRADTAWIEIALEPSDDFEIVQPIHARWACDRVAFSAMTEPENVLDTLVPRASRKGQRLLTGLTPVSRDPGGDVIARFKTDESVELVETKGASTRILARSANAAFVGWVPTSMVAPYTTGAAYGSGHGRLGGAHYSSGPRCDKDIPLYARIGQRLVVVGEIMAGHYFAVEDSDGRKVVNVRSPAFDLLPNVTLEVMPQDLEHCPTR